VRLGPAHIEASLCQVIVFGTVQGAMAGTVGFVARLVVALVSGSGSDLSEEPAFRMQAGRAGLSLNPPFQVWLAWRRVDVRVSESCWVVQGLADGHDRFDASRCWCLGRVVA
jgi:hypothetical protein